MSRYQPDQRQQTISSVVRVYMAAHDEKQEDLGRALGVSRPAIGQKLAGRNRWSVEDLGNLSMHYGVPVEEFIRGEILLRLGVVIGKPAPGLAVRVPA